MPMAASASAAAAKPASSRIASRAIAVEAEATSAIVRASWTITLGSSERSPDASAVCLDAMDDPEWPVRALAASSLGRLRDERAVPRLARAMGDPAYWVRHHVAEAMAALGEPGAEALRQGLHDANPFVRDMAAQTRQVFENLKAALDAAGATFADILKVTVYLTDVNDRAKINPVRQQYFGAARPASTLIGIKELAIPGMKVEIEAVVGLRC